MNAPRLAALAAAAAVVLAGCNLTLDPDAVQPVAAQGSRLRGACAGASAGHRSCGGLVTQGAGEGAGGAHRVVQGRVDPAAVPRMSGGAHQVLYTHVSQ